jgi:hypothetical protein
MVDSETMTIAQTILIIIGWVVVHKLSTARDRDKARRELLVKAADSLIQDTSELIKKSWDYHTKKRDMLLEIEIKMMLQDISTRTSMLSDISSDAKELGSCRSAIIAMKKSITALHFEDEHDLPLGQESSQIQSITAESLRVKLCLSRFKQTLFKTAK